MCTVNDVYNLASYIKNMSLLKLVKNMSLLKFVNRIENCVKMEGLHVSMERDTLHNVMYQCSQLSSGS